MNIVGNLESVIKRYLKEVETGKQKKPCRCKVCGRECNLWWHAEYTRKLITLRGIYKIPIKRLYCPLCEHTFALIPEFIEKSHRYAKDAINLAIKYLKEYTYDKIADLFMDMYSLYISNRTLYNWENKFCHN